mmetsp:Transcript_20976/g.31075  ORF Transcript_20976/g.31075 Transcript_20976/m.31075 type:complete len:98 (+) Transcript_20976:69-362(+)
MFPLRKGKEDGGFPEAREEGRFPSEFNREIVTTKAVGFKAICCFQSRQVYPSFHYQSISNMKKKLKEGATADTVPLLDSIDRGNEVQGYLSPLSTFY